MDINWTLIFAALIGSIPGLIVAWRTHYAVNGTMTLFVEMMKEKQAVAVAGARAEGALEEKAAEQVRKGDAAIAVAGGKKEDAQR